MTPRGDLGLPLRRGLVIDLFAGAGGASIALEAALGIPVDIAINHDPIALAVHKANHPNTLHLECDIWEVKPLQATRGRPVDVLWASPDCTHFSVAKGGQPRKQNIRSLAEVVVRWARQVRPTIIYLENVREFRDWGPLDDAGHPIKARKGEDFRRWRRKFIRLGYKVSHQVLDASKYAAPTKRLRLFLVARCDGEEILWPVPTHGQGGLPLHTAAECIDWSLPCPSIFGRRKALVDKTLWRIAQGVKRFVLENPRPFIVKVNHGKYEARVNSIDAPLSTITATQRGHAVIVPTLITSGYGEREGQAARVPGLEKPLGTVVASSTHHCLIAVFISKYFGDAGQRPGSASDEPLATITAQDHNALAAVGLVKFRGTSRRHLHQGPGWRSGPGWLTPGLSQRTEAQGGPV